MTATELTAADALKVCQKMIDCAAAKLAWQARVNGLDVDDLKQAARLRVVADAAGYDPEKGKPSTYFGRRIFGAMMDTIRDASFATRLAAKSGEPLVKIEPLATVNARLFADHSHGDRMAAKNSGESFRIDPPHHDSEPADDTEAELLAMIRRRGVRLHKSEARLIRWHYGRGLTQKAISERLGVHESRISQRLKAIIDHLREHCTAEERVRSYRHDRFRFKPAPVVVRERGERVNGVDEGVMLEDLELRVVTRNGEGEKAKLVVVCPHCGGHRRVTMGTIRTWYCTHDGVPACTPQTCRRVSPEATA